MKLPIFALILIAPLLLKAQSEPVLTQFATIDSLLAGVYDGPFTLDEVRAAGDIGLGTFDAIDGEMIVFDGVIYQATGSGEVKTPGGSAHTPFAAVVHFEADEVLPVDAPLDYEALKAKIDAALPNQNLPIAFRIEGTFTRMHVRAAPRQEKPYKPLHEALANQPEFNFENLSGAIVGFRLPPYVKGINVPGYHLHFISEDGSKGGHILDFVMTSGEIGADVVYRFDIHLPEDEAFAKADLSQDRSKELHQVETQSTSEKTPK